MGSGLISLLFTLGFTMWVYNKLQERSGGNTQQSLAACGIIAIFTFALLFSLLTLFI